MPEAYQCGLCDMSFPTREDLIQHNVQEHGWSEEESRERVLEKYPRS